MSREAHVRFWEGVGVKLPRATHFVVLGERHLRRILTAHFAYYHRARTHLSLDKDTPDGRPIEPPEAGNGPRDSRSRGPASSLCTAGGIAPRPGLILPSGRHLSPAEIQRLMRGLMA